MELLNKFILIHKKDYSKVKKYVYAHLNEVWIFTNFISGKITELMEKNSLEGYCIETSDVASLFFEDNDYVVQGTLDFEDGPYFHSWLIFNYEKEDYVLDVSLNVLCTKKLYYKLFNPVEYNKVLSSTIKKYFLENICNAEENIIYFPIFKDNVYKSKASILTNVEDRKITSLCLRLYKNV